MIRPGHLSSSSFRWLCFLRDVARSLYGWRRFIDGSLYEARAAFGT